MRKLKPAAFAPTAHAKNVRARSARAVALEALLNGGSQLALDAALRSHAGVSAADRALATALVYGTVKMQRALAWSLAHYLKRPLAGLAQPLRWSLLLGAYQLLYMDRIPAHSAVDESVSLARSAGHAGTAALANAVLRKLAASKVTPPEPRPTRRRCLQIMPRFRIGLRSISCNDSGSKTRCASRRESTVQLPARRG